MAPDEEFFVPKDDQRVFGAGIKRKRVHFVPAATTGPIQTSPSATHARKAGDRYLSIVLPSEARKNSRAAGEPVLFANTEEAASQTYAAAATVCDICNLPLESESGTSVVPSKSHETSLVHQVCLAHSHPPSHLDRSRHGLRYLSSYGWDPDGRLGLGAKGEGITAPLKGKPKNDTVGLGVKTGLKAGQVVEKKVVQKLDAKGVRKKDMEDREKRDNLQAIFYGNPDVERYLGPNI